MANLLLIERFFSFWFCIRIMKIEREKRLATENDMREIAQDMAAFLHAKGLVPPSGAFYIDEYPHKIPHNRVLH